MKSISNNQVKFFLLAFLFLTVPHKLIARDYLQNISPDVIPVTPADSVLPHPENQEADSTLTADSLDYIIITDTLTSDGTRIPVRVFDQENSIMNASALHGFFALVEQAESPVQVYHIGDSHVAGKVFPSVLAAKMHAKFGYGKTTLITPKTYSRAALRKRKSASIRAAKAKRAAQALRRKKVSKRRSHGRKRAELAPDAASMQQWLAMADGQYAGIYADSFTRSDRSESNGLFNIPIDSTEIAINKPGLHFTAFAVNGKSFRYFADNALVKRHSTELHPELVIISLGTNDLFGKEYDREYIRGAVIDLIASVRYASPKVSILLTLPADSYIKKKKSNPYLKLIKDELAYLATEFNCAYWDPVPVFGGYGIMNAWYKRKLCGKDRIHLTREGYTLFATKLFEALEKAEAGYQLAKQPLK